MDTDTETENGNGNGTFNIRDFGLSTRKRLFVPVIFSVYLYVYFLDIWCFLYLPTHTLLIPIRRPTFTTLLNPIQRPNFTTLIRRPTFVTSIPYTIRYLLQSYNLAICIALSGETMQYIDRL